MIRRVAWLLAALGVLPFVAATVALLWPQSHIRIPAIAGMVTYAAVILSFLGGIEWGVALNDPYAGASRAEKERLRATALVMSTIPSLAGWGVLWLPSPQWQLGAALGLFAVVWAGDLVLARQGLLPAWFVDLRSAITVAVVVTLGAALYLL